MIPVVTSCDETFLPGLKALHNSFLKNSADGFEFWALLTGSQQFADEVERLGIKCILNAPFPCDDYPTSSYYPVANPAMYKNLLMPQLFAEHERSIYIDTDSLILQNLKPLADVNMGDKPIAGTRCNGNRASNYSPTRPNEALKFGPMTSLMVFNHAAWEKHNVLQRFIEAMQRRDITWHMIGQGVLHYILSNNWVELPWNWQAHAGHDTYFTAPKHDILTLHFLGTKPWREFSDPSFVTERKLITRKVWRSYADLDAECTTD